MSTIKNNRTRSNSRIAPKGVGILGAAVVALASLGCTGGLELRPKRPTFEAQAEFGGAATASAVATTSSAPSSYETPASQETSPLSQDFVQSGGLSPETAEMTSVGATVTGRVNKGAPRYYALDLAAGDYVTVKAYGRQLLEDGYSEFDVALLEPDLVDLKNGHFFLSEGPEKTERETFSVTISEAGRYYIKVVSERQPIEYQVKIQAVSHGA